MYKNFKIISFLILGFLCVITLDVSAKEKIKIGLLVPMTGENKELGQEIIKSTRIALKDINTEDLEIYLKDTNSNPNTAIKSAKELNEMGVKIVIGPVFHKSLIYLDEVQEITFLALTNKTLDLPKNVISAGINATSQLNAIKKFIKENEIKKTIFLTPNLDYKDEVKKAIKQSKIKTFKQYIYDTEPTKLTAQIEKITNYKKRKQNLEDEIKRLENLDEDKNEKLIEKLKKRDTLGRVKFDSVIIADFDESLKSVTTSLLYTDISPKDKYFITLNQWFDESLLKEISSQPMYFPSINKENYEKFSEVYFDTFNDYPNQLSFLSYDLIGLVYFLILQNNSIIDEKIFSKKTQFKGKIGIFEIKDNKIFHILNFYKIEDMNFKKIF